MAVPRDDLSRDRLDREVHFLRDIFFDARIVIGESADGAGNRAGRDLLAGLFQAFKRAGEFSVGGSEFDAEARWLGVDAVRAADGWRVLIFECAALERG